MSFDLGAVVAHFKADITNFQQGISQAGKNLDSFRDKTSALEGGVNKLFDGFTNLAKKGALVATGALAGFAVMSVKAASDFEGFRTQFEVMLGSADKAKKLLADVAEMAKKTPFELPDVVKGTQRLLAMGSSSEKVLDQFRMLGDISLGNTQKLDSLLLAFGKIQTKGKASMEELNIVLEAGVPILQVLADQTHKTKEEVIKMASDGKISFDDVTKAMTTMTSQGGIAFQGMEKQSQTLDGVWSNLKDTLTQFALRVAGMTVEGDIMKGGFFDKLKTAGEQALVWIGNNQDKLAEWGTKIGEFVVVYGEKFFVFIRDAIDFMVKHKDTILLLIEGLLALKAVLIVQGVVLAVQGLATALLNLPTMIAIGIAIDVLLIERAYRAARDLRDTVSKMDDQTKKAWWSSLNWWEKTVTTLTGNKPNFNSSNYSGGFATGGFIPPGHWGTTGENGVEAVFGGRSGATIIPNSGGASINISLAGATILGTGGGAAELAEMIGDSLIKVLQRNQRI